MNCGPGVAPILREAGDPHEKVHTLRSAGISAAKLETGPQAGNHRCRAPVETFARARLHWTT
jgi:hypothetical protein